MSRSDGDSADYYVLPEGATQLQDLISHRDMNSQIGEIFRACYRYGIVSHSDKMRDAKKIRFYAQAEVERLEKLSAAQNTGGPIPANATYIVGEHPSECLVPSHIISDIPSDVTDRQQWKIGDIFEVTSSMYEFDAGEHVRLINDMTKERSPCCEYLDGRDHWWVAADSLKFISRPTSTAK